MNNEKKNLEIYLNDIGGRDLLSDEEERQLAERIAAGDGEAAGQLAEANLRYVVAVARGYAGQGLSMDDLVSEGNVGMLKAATRFKAEGGKRFVAFAAPFIRRSIEAAIEQQNNLCKATGDAAARKEGKAVSMDAPIPAGSQTTFTLKNVLEDKSSPQADAHIEREGLSEELVQRMDVLNDREREVVTSYYGIGTSQETMAEIAGAMGLKRERVRQIRDKALRKMR
jgi:RNA polymerase primary sigma factor